MEPKPQTPRGAWIALALAGALLAGAIGYASFRDSPAEATANVQEAAGDLDSLRAAAESTPKDSQAWVRLGMAHFEREEFAAAATALERATALTPNEARLWSVLGEARVKSSERDPMPAAAVDAFRKALAIDPKDPPARYFMAVSRDLSGDHKGAIDDWFVLLADTPPGAPWEGDLRRTIEQVGKINKVDVADRLAKARPASTPSLSAGQAMPGPSAADLQAASKMAPSEQDAMARGMVERLEGRLKADPSNVAGWSMLMRSRMTLGEPAKAAAALKDAIAANPGAKAQLEQEAAALGVPK
jgi:cytochrome c-type biogenesis protein CcmH